MLGRRLVCGWLCCWASVLAVPDAASACQFGIRFDIGEVPANGLVRLRWRCLDRYCPDDMVPNPLRIVEAATQAEVPGAVVWSEGGGTTLVNVVWKPAQPLVAGRTYQVADFRLTSITQGETVFTVAPAVKWVPTADLELEAGLETVEGSVVGDVSCPARFPKAPCPPSTEKIAKQVSLYSRLQTLLWVHAYATHRTGSVPPLKRRAEFWRDGDAAPDLASKPWSLDSDSSQRIDRQAARYCYRTAVQSLLDGSEREWEGCLPHGDLPALEVRDDSPDRIAAETIRCAEPPPGLEQAWCEQSERLCSGEISPRPAQSDCDNVAKHCAAPPDDEAPDASVDAPSEPRKPRMRPSRDAGCSIPRGPNAGSAPWLLAVALAAVTLRRRRPRSRV